MNFLTGLRVVLFATILSFSALAYSDGTNTDVHSILKENFRRGFK